MMMANFLRVYLTHLALASCLCSGWLGEMLGPPLKLLPFEHARNRAQEAWRRDVECYRRQGDRRTRFGRRGPRPETDEHK